MSSPRQVTRAGSNPRLLAEQLLKDLNNGIMPEEIVYHFKVDDNYYPMYMEKIKLPEASTSVYGRYRGRRSHSVATKEDAELEEQDSLEEDASYADLYQHQIEDAEEQANSEKRHREMIENMAKFMQHARQVNDAPEVVAKVSDSNNLGIGGITVAKRGVQLVIFVIPCVASLFALYQLQYYFTNAERFLFESLYEEYHDMAPSTELTNHYIPPVSTQVQNAWDTLIVLLFAHAERLFGACSVDGPRAICYDIKMSEPLAFDLGKPQCTWNNVYWLENVVDAGKLKTMLSIKPSHKRLYLLSTNRDLCETISPTKPGMLYQSYSSLVTAIKLLMDPNITSKKVMNFTLKTHFRFSQMNENVDHFIKWIFSASNYVLPSLFAFAKQSYASGLGFSSILASLVTLLTFLLQFYELYNKGTLSDLSSNVFLVQQLSSIFLYFSDTLSSIIYAFIKTKTQDDQTARISLKGTLYTISERIFIMSVTIASLFNEINGIAYNAH